MKVIRKPLTKEQKERGIVFSSCFTNNEVESKGDEIFEMTYSDTWSYGANVRENLTSDKFANHIIRR